ncbi:MAG: non-ribosomal peptide synthetase, partial [bacterium]|nr:non-ribosomal peptide synthetase [bacterium]
LYRTGDLARWLANGKIEFMGRIDRQVKIRGYRIELEELESRLLASESVREAVIIARENAKGEKYLCAYLVSPYPLNTKKLRGILLKSVPEYMLPSYFMSINKIPLTANGKLDRNALPEPIADVPARKYTEPRNDKEILLTEIWQQALDIDKIGINDDFFALGGDSIKAIQIISLLKKHKLTTDVTRLFFHKTIRQLAKHLKVTGKNRLIHQGVVTGYVSLTPLQHWFINNHYPCLNHFNQSVMLFSKTGFNNTLMEKTFTKIVAHHDALRMVFKFDNHKVLLKNRGIEGKLFELFHHDRDFSDLTQEETASEIKRASNSVQRSLDLQKGPLLKLATFKTPAGDYLLVVAHHFVIDAVSWRILLEELQIGYTRAAEKKDIVFQEKTDSFKDWARCLTKYADSRQLFKEIPFWKTIDETIVEKLPVDNIIEKDKRKLEYMNTVTITLGKKDTGKLLKDINHAFNTEINDILMTALAVTIKEWTGMEKIPVDLEGHGRESLAEHIEIHRTIGWFTSIYPVVLDMSGIEAISTALPHI